MRLGICCIAKNEELYINDWLEYHFNLGFDEVYIYDNNDEKYIKDYIKKDLLSKVTIIDCHRKNQYQLSAYNDFFRNYSSKFDWVSVIDCDEFITLDNFKSIKEYLNTLKNIDVVMLTWKVFGDDGKIFDDTSIPVYKRFFQEYIGPIYKGCGIMIKCLLNCSRGQKYTWTSCHCPVDMKFNTINSLGQKYKLNPSIDKFYDKVFIRHYMTKSLSEFVNQKLNRQDARFRKKCSLDYYFKINQKTQEKLDFFKQQ